MRSGIFIVFEGGEFVGKSTQIEILASKIHILGKTVIVTKEPGGTKEGEAIKKDILSGNYTHAEQLKLFMKDRKIHIEKVIEPALLGNNIVICDRFTDSTIAYQHYGFGLPIEEIKTYDKEARKDINPDIVLLLDMDPKDAFLRAKIRGEEMTVFEMEKKDFHDRVRNGYLAIAKENPLNHEIISAGKSQKDVTKNIWEVVKSKFSL